MDVRALKIADAYEITPTQHRDDRGVFLETFRPDQLALPLGYMPRVLQANCSVSRRGTVRGIHYASVPPGQAKYVMCQQGSVMDVVVDIRVGSPTFGSWDSVTLDDVDRRCVYVSEGLGHAFVAITESATVSYLCSQPFRPEREHGIDPTDPALGIEWPHGLELIISTKDAKAPNLQSAREAGMLPTIAECDALMSSLRSDYE